MTSNRPRTPRAKLPSETPLDDGSRSGTDAWREVDGVAFCHWDRWLLRLALEEPQGLASIAREFRRRARDPRGSREDAEAMLAQLADLGARLVTLHRTPADLLEPLERESTWLRRKAFRRVWHATSIDRTQAMVQTPRAVLAARAREGNWGAFPVSPGPTFTRLGTLYRGGYADYLAAGLVVLRLELEGEDLLRAAADDDERLAVRRAILGAAIEAMGHVDDSGDRLGEHFREQEEAYLAQVAAHVDRPGILRDLLELAIWEDYGLVHHLPDFLRNLPETTADLAVRELARLIGELRGAELKYPLARARELRAWVLESASVDRVESSRGPRSERGSSRGGA